MRRLSFVVPAYGDSPYLGECLASLKAQSVNVDISICTATPSEYISKIADEFKVPVRVNEAGGSISKDWNYALSSVDAQIVVLAHQDDLYDKQYAVACLDHFARHPHSAIVFTGCYEMINGRLTRNSPREIVKRVLRRFAYLNNDVVNSRRALKRLLGLGCSIPCPSVAFNRAEIQDFRFTDDYSLTLDWDAWIRIGEQGRGIGFVREPLLVHRIHAMSETSKGIADSRRASEDFRMFQRFWPPMVARFIQRVYALGY